MMKQAVVGLLAHVDAGKTTLAEAMLFATGAIRTRGRVDHGDAHLDFEPVERERGITVFSKQAVVEHGDVRLMLVDTPGHVDFCAETERTLSVLDLAVLVIGANDGVQGHTRVLWHLLERYRVPTVVFVNKVDLAVASREDVLVQLGSRLGASFSDFSALDDPDVLEQVALSDEDALEEYVSEGSLSLQTIRGLVTGRMVFPCLFGSALRAEGVTELLDLLGTLAPERTWPQEFGARVYKVSRSRRGERLCWLKVTGGVLRAKAPVEVVDATGRSWTEKPDQLRVYSGERYAVVTEVAAGQLCAAIGLDHAFPGGGIGCEGRAPRPSLVPVLDYCVYHPGHDAHAVVEALRVLSDEDPLLAVLWDEEAGQVRVQLMGSVQLEIVREALHERFGLVVDFGPGEVLYKETIEKPVEGIGHFEPLRHYAEVHLTLEPLARGSGVQFGTRCPEDDLAKNWQRLILTNAMERTHKGVLVGAPLTDVRITLVAGRAHEKHTEGGDFRQATYRAIRQGLMRARSVLLEPWYGYELEVPADKVGRAIADLQRMSASFGAPDVRGEVATFRGEVPVSRIRDYALQVSAYTAGQGHLSLEPIGYKDCLDEADVIEKAAYDPESDLAHTPDSVFCSHGAGYTVKWHEVERMAHVVVDHGSLRPWREADAAFFGNA